MLYLSVNLLICNHYIAFGDREPKVQLAACDAMFNILKSFREQILDHNFPNTFDKVVSVVANPNNDVKEWGRKLIELLEDIVYGAIIKHEIFDLEELLNKIYKKLWKSKNQDIQLVLLKWIETLNSMTDYDVLDRLPKFLEKYFEILSTNPKHDVYEMALSQLKVFLVDYEKCKWRRIQLDVDILHKILGFLNKNKKSDIDKSRHLAIIWLEQFLKYFKQDLENRNDSYGSDNSSKDHDSEIE